MPTNPLVTATLRDIEKAIAAITPEIACLSEISAEEEFTLYRNRAKKQHTSITGNVVKVCCDYEAIAALLRCRLTQDNSIFGVWGIKEIHVSFKDYPIEIVYTD